ncbi:Arginine N-succinyltransferase subunit beta [Pseudoalteromonas nigrifaciens]|nr:Arginine N-succinyltransferase subunit beta [Pseudoalteromonas nigrifaciens]
MDFPTADYLTGIGQKVFIAELMPKYPIYVNLLSKNAQAVIGKVHDNTRPAIELLKSEGFTFNGYVDIFDAGPTVEAKVDNIATIRNAKHFKVEIGEPSGDTMVLLANEKLTDFRATVVPMTFDERMSSIVITQQVADALYLQAGDSVSATTI